jgi:hypothetical protein
MDFLTPVFFMKRLTLVLIDMPRSDFEKKSQFRGVIRILNIEKSPPAVNDSGESKTEH